MYWFNPMSWILRAYVILEFKSDKYNYDLMPGKSAGDVYLDAFGYRKEDQWIWGSILYLIGLTILFLGLTIAVLNYWIFPAKHIMGRHEMVRRIEAAQQMASADPNAEPRILSPRTAHQAAAETTVSHHSHVNAPEGHEHQGHHIHMPHIHMPHFGHHDGIEMTHVEPAKPTTDESPSTLHVWALISIFLFSLSFRATAEFAEKNFAAGP